MALDDDLLADLDRVAKSRNETRSAVMRAAIRAGLEIVKSGSAADVLTLDSELTRYIDEMANAYNMTRQAIILEAIRRGARAVNAHHMFETAQGVSPETMKAMLRHDPNAEPHLRAVLEAKIALSTLEVQFEDMLRYVPEARKRKELIERNNELGIKRHGSAFTQWGCGTSTESLKRNITVMESELAKGKTASPEALAEYQKLEAMRRSPAPYPLLSVRKFPVKMVKPAKKKSRK